MIYKTAFILAALCLGALAADEVKCDCRTDIRCYKSLQDCKDRVNVVTFSSGRNTECLDIDRPYFECWEELGICRDSETCKVPGGNGQQDPHFKGFDGSQYYFDGEAGRDYNIISDPTMQLNAHFVRLQTLQGTYMGRIGLLFGNESLVFDPYFGVFFNGQVITEGEVELPAGTFRVESIEDRFRMTFQNEVYLILARVMIEKSARNQAYINLQASILSKPNNPHGILGQTAKGLYENVAAGSFKVQGEESDYLLRDGLLGTEFTFNRFTGAIAKGITGGSGHVSRTFTSESA